MHSIASLKNKKSSSAKYFKNLFKSNNIELSVIYLLPRIAIITLIEGPFNIEP